MYSPKHRTGRYSHDRSKNDPQGHRRLRFSSLFTCQRTNASRRRRPNNRERLNPSRRRIGLLRPWGRPFEPNRAADDADLVAGLAPVNRLRESFLKLSRRRSKMFLPRPKSRQSHPARRNDAVAAPSVPQDQKSRRHDWKRPPEELAKAHGHRPETAPVHAPAGPRPGASLPRNPDTRHDGKIPQPRSRNATKEAPI